MDKFIVSARKYRPQIFSTVVGQSHITTTLKNAIKNHQLAHAFLFCGPRGVGKTTCARILAKTINCEHPTPDGEACNTCHSCVSFNEGTSLNIHELDAASNNSVDDIRSLVEQVRFAPQVGNYKVYIVDEVHMLSTSAFNAFLKTLEEPPPYAIFILATTEKHKILPTILSRCQIFDFKRITPGDTVEHLEEICEKEHIKAEKAALQVIAQKSEGCMRDSLSILDKIVSFTNGELSYQNTLEHLNILDADYYFKLTECMLQQDLAGAMLLYDDINSKGFEGDLVLNGFAEFMRNLLVCKDARAAALMEVVESFKDRYVALAQKTPLSYIISTLNVLNEAEINYKGARNKRLHVELTLIKLCYLQQALEVAASPEDGLTKKKIAETARPVPFRVLPVIEFKKNKSTAPAKTVAAEVVEHTATLIVEEKIERPAEVVPTPANNNTSSVPVFSPSSSPAPAVSAKSVGKLGALNAIRQQYVAGTAATQAVAKELSEEGLAAAWAAFIQKLKDAKNPAESSFTFAKLRIKDERSFEIVTPNTLQQKFIENERIDLTDFLQAEFNNRNLTYSVIVEDDPSLALQIEAPLSSKERFMIIAEQYPAVKDLKDKLRLDLDF